MGKARTSAELVQLSATSNPHVPSSMPGKKRRGTEGWGRAKKVDRKKGGQGGGVRYSFSLSHIGLLSLLRCPERSEKKRERGRRESRKEKKKRKR